MNLVMTEFAPCVNGNVQVMIFPLFKQVKKPVNVFMTATGGHKLNFLGHKLAKL